MATDTQMFLNNKQHDTFIEYFKSVLLTQQSARDKLRSNMILQDKLYQREGDLSLEQTRAKAFNQAGDPTKFQNIVVPIVKPQIETAVAYQTSVFLTSTPIFQVVSHAEFVDEALQLSTILDNQAREGGWTRQFMLSFRDGYKYNYSPIEVSWEQRTVASLETDEDFSKEEAKPKDVLWRGNVITRLDPYNTFQDPNVTPTEIYKDGEFAGFTKLYSRINFKKFLHELRSKQTRDTQALESPFTGVTSEASSGTGYFIPIINPAKDLGDTGKQGTNWMKWAYLPDDSVNQIQYRDFYEVTVLYCRILPGEFGLKVPSRYTPQIWKLIIINNSVVIYCERQTNAHNWIPILIGQPYEDGLGYQTKSLADDAEPFQAVTSAFMNSMVASRRRAVSDRVLYDPSRVAAAQINSENPSAKMPVKPAAYGKKISDAVYAFPYREDQNSMSMTQIRDLISMSNELAGQNSARQGQFVKGNKSPGEFETIMSNATGRDRMAAILYEVQVLRPMKHVFKTNILQYQPTANLYSQAEEVAVAIDPIALRKATLEFKLSDGLIPSEEIMNAEALTVALQTMQAVPEIGAGYNITPMFSYMIKSSGGDLRPFEKPQEQIAFEQAMAQWQQLATLAIDKDLNPEKALTPPPKPEDFGYNPSGKPQSKKEDPSLPGAAVGAAA